LKYKQQRELCSQQSKSKLWATKGYVLSKNSMSTYLPTYLIQKQPFFGWFIYSQKAILKIKSAKIKCFLRIFNSWKLILFFLKLARVIIYMVQMGSQKYSTIFLNFIFVFSLLPNLAKYSCGNSHFGYITKN
jgi:hypothetical protein